MEINLDLPASPSLAKEADVACLCLASVAITNLLSELSVVVPPALPDPQWLSPALSSQLWWSSGPLWRISDPPMLVWWPSTPAWGT